MKKSNFSPLFGPTLSLHGPWKSGSWTTMGWSHTSGEHDLAVPTLDTGLDTPSANTFRRVFHTYFVKHTLEALLRAFRERTRVNHRVVVIMGQGPGIIMGDGTSWVGISRLYLTIVSIQLLQTHSDAYFALSS